MSKYTSNLVAFSGGALWRIPTVQAYTGLSKSEIYRRVRGERGGFPPPVKLGVRSVAWRATDVQNWAANRPTAEVTR